MHNRRFDPDQAPRLDDPERLQWFPPQRLIEAIQLQPGMAIADIGAGTGFFAAPMAEFTGSSGVVYAVDVEKKMLARLREKIELCIAPPNIVLVEADAIGTSLPYAGCDRVLVANVWHEIEDARAALNEFARILRSDGCLAILDWRPDATRPPGPPLDHRVSCEQTCATLVRSGWKLVSSEPFGPYSYLVMAAPPQS